jgi:hypothetical protein
MNILIQVHSASLRQIDYADRKTGQPARLLAQTAYLHTVNENGEKGPVPDKFEFVLPKGVSTGTPPGLYTLHPSAVYVDRNGRLSVSPRLAPVPANAKV